jgi:CcmD family protein
MTVVRTGFDRRRGAVFAMAAAVVGSLSRVLSAQAPQAPQGFTVGGNVVHENLPATPFVFIAYAIVWAVLLGYVFLLWRRAGRVASELERVNARLAARP